MLTSSYYPPHSPMNDILSGLRNRKYFRCVLRCSGKSSGDMEGWKSCYVVLHSSDGSRRSVAVEGDVNVNRALDGDVVAVELIETETGEDSVTFKSTDAPLGVGEISCSTADASSSQIEGLAVSTDQDQPRAQSPEQLGKESPLKGRVVGIIRRNWRQYAGSLVPLETIDRKLDMRDTLLKGTPYSVKIFAL